MTNRTLTWSEHLKEYETKKQLGTAMTMSPLNSSWDQSPFVPTSVQLERNPDLAGFCQKLMSSGTIAPVQYRLELIRYFNQIVRGILPFIDFSHVRSSASLHTGCHAAVQFSSNA